MPVGMVGGRAGLLACSLAALVLCANLCVGLDWDSLGRVGGGAGAGAGAGEGGGAGGGDGALLLDAGGRGSGRDSASSHLDHMFDKVRTWALAFSVRPTSRTCTVHVRKASSPTLRDSEIISTARNGRGTEIGREKGERSIFC